MQNSNDNILNVLTTTRKCIQTLSASSQKYAKREVFRITRKHERQLGKLLADMNPAEVEHLEDEAIDAIS
jgi:hypothetical protein